MHHQCIEAVVYVEEKYTNINMVLIMVMWWLVGGYRADIKKTVSEIGQIIRLHEFFMQNVQY